MKKDAEQEVDSLEDSKMIRRIQEGDQEMFRELIEKYYDDVFRFCRYKTGHEQAAYDCTQDTFLHLTKYIYDYADRRKFKAWLFSIARNACHDYFRKNHSGMEEWNWEQVQESKAVTADSDQAMRRVELQTVLGQALEQLPMMQREAVVLHYIYDFKVREIASMTGVSLPTAKSRVRQGLMKLKEILPE